MPSEWNFPWVYYSPLFDDSEIFEEEKKNVMNIINE